MHHYWYPLKPYSYIFYAKTSMEFQVISFTFRRWIYFQICQHRFWINICNGSHRNACGLYCLNNGHSPSGRSVNRLDLVYQSLWLDAKLTELCDRLVRTALEETYTPCNMAVVVDSAAEGTGSVVPKGFPVEILYGQVDAKLLCTLCKLLPRNPVQGFCGHRFCHNCIADHLARFAQWP